MPEWRLLVGLPEWLLVRLAEVLPSRVLEGIARDIWKLPPDRLRYVPNGVDLARFGAVPTEAPPWAGHFAAGVPVIGTVAALRPEKNLGRLLEAFGSGTACIVQPVAALVRWVGG